jgi:hypothetical protein
MGGNIFKHPKMTRELYDDIKNDVIAKLSPREVLVPESFLSKETFGDIDFVMEFPKLTNDFIKDTFGIEDNDIHHNSSVISINYRGAQCDFCHFDKEDVETAYNYMRNSDCSNMVGVLCRASLGYKLSHVGLVYPVRIKAEDCLGDILVSKDFKKILQFVDLDYEKWNAGFLSQEELFEWIIKSKYFNNSFFYYENLNHENRTRNSKRLVYGNFVTWLYAKNGIFENCHMVSENKQEHLFRGLLHFHSEGFWINDAYTLIKTRYMTETAKRIFNGNDIQTLTDTTGMVLGKICREFNEWLRTTYNLTRTDGYNSISWFVAEKTKCEMIKMFMDWYNTIYTR